jgi:hypothetical protein
VAQSWAATWHPFIGLWFIGSKLWSLWDSSPGPPTLVKSLVKSIMPMGHTLILVKYTGYNIYKFMLYCIWWGVGPGLSPDLRFYCVNIEP